MKTRFKYSFSLCLILCAALMLTACGKKENKVNSSGVAGSSPFYTGNPALSGTAGTAIVNQVQSIKNSVSCLNGYRLTNDVSFYIQGGYGAGTNTIAGNFVEGFNTNGTINQLYVGVSVYRDLMFVTQVTNGSQVVGYNVTLSFCEMKSNPSTLPSIISNERRLRAFQAPWGINVITKSGCSFGLVASTGVGYDNYGRPKATYITSERNLSNPYSPPDAQIPTAFAAPGCGQ